MCVGGREGGTVQRSHSVRTLVDRPVCVFTRVCDYTGLCWTRVFKMRWPRLRNFSPPLRVHTHVLERARARTRRRRRRLHAASFPSGRIATDTRPFPLHVAPRIIIIYRLVSFRKSMCIRIKYIHICVYIYIGRYKCGGDAAARVLNNSGERKMYIIKDDFGYRSIFWRNEIRTNLFPDRRSDSGKRTNVRTQRRYYTKSNFVVNFFFSLLKFIN